MDRSGQEAPLPEVANPLPAGALATDTPTSAAMAPLLTGRLFCAERYHFFPVLDSTNRHAAQLAQEGAESGTVVVAEQQTQGRGRLGRSWSSPASINLYCSVVLRPDVPPRNAAQLTLLAGLALARALVEAGLREVEIKWPNDLLLGGRKVAGILTEARIDPQRVQYVVVGMGLNVNGTEDDFPPDLRGKAVSLAAVLGAPLNRAGLLAGLLAQLDRLYGQFCREGFSPLRAEWLSFSRLLGRAVQVNLANGSFSGRAVALDAEGCLLVQRADGMLSRVVAGDVMPLGED
ncbi:MAG: biotin--[acetyl-CoA-carboxylase] ligase [Magnetococcus sp. YQC-3]